MSAARGLSLSLRRSKTHDNEAMLWRLDIAHTHTLSEEPFFYQNAKVAELWSRAESLETRHSSYKESLIPHFRPSPLPPHFRCFTPNWPGLAIWLFSRPENAQFPHDELSFLSAFLKPHVRIPMSECSWEQPKSTGDWMMSSASGQNSLSPTHVGPRD